MGHAAIAIRYALLALEGHKGTSHRGPPREESEIRSTNLFEELSDESAEVHSTQDNPSVWQMYFDGASRTIPHVGLVAGVGIVLISPQNHVISLAFSLTEPCTNNVAEYNALLIGLQLAHQLEVRNL